MAKNQNGFARATSIVGPVDFSDDESTPLTAQEQHTGGQKIIKETKAWDLFRNPPAKVESGSMADQKCLEMTMKIIKVLIYLLVFSVVLCCTVIANGAILLMTSQLRANKTTPYGNRLLGQTRTFVVISPEEENIAWIWNLIFAFAFPELCTLIRSLRICIFKSWKRPDLDDFMLVLFMESSHVVGLAIMFIHILPGLDVVQGMMLLSCVCFVPGLLGLFSRKRKHNYPKQLLFYLVDVLALAAQATSFVLWPLIYNWDKSLWLIPVALILISCRWWENYVSIHSSLCLIKYLGRVKERLQLTRYIIYTFMTVWKIVAFIISSAVILHLKGHTINHLFEKFWSVFTSHSITVTEIQSTLGNDTMLKLSDVQPTVSMTIITSNYLIPIYVMLIQICSAWLAYVFGKFACKILIQEFSYALPINLSAPVTISLMIALCVLRNDNPSILHGIIPDYLFFESPTFTNIENLLLNEYAWVWLLWLLSQTWITLHIWTPKCKRLETTEKLFVLPMYDGLLITQSMGLNRQRDDSSSEVIGDSMEVETERINDDFDVLFEQTGVSTAPTSFVKSTDYVTRIYVCATMWHETKDEMIEFLKSILRLDEDQCARRNAQNFLKVVDPDYYELETHIFFDDAFEISDHDDNESQVNRFVKLLVETLDEAASKVHQTNMHLNAPKKYPTPYGGRLVWTLPGKTKMIAHLKDKSKIRHRKRWSQVMYMYYLLGHRLMQLPISVDRKEVIAENTYLLALDGDIDFQPIAVTLLVDLMKKNKNLGAACGRIHPVGSGPMVWYQMFEYAIGHWLQKATEHMIGCVLCSPGCFSLFRGKALMDDRVMKKYTTRSHEARHYVQYDQGEDRWLCTLLLQRGYRVEYSAASDAYTHAPEGFNEFYNQRRRWVPSTMANIMDLITDSKNTIKNNDNISFMYMCYQILLMLGTILGPGTIFLMITGAIAAAFGLDNWTSFYYNLIPILVFMVVCFTCKSETQLFFAAVISILYGLVMMAVIVAILIQMVDDGWSAPTSLFLYLVSGQLIIAGLMHPQELMCLPCGVIYYVTIPSMYLLLVIYSITNLNNVAWGTREVQVKKTLAELEEEKKEAEEAKRKAKKNSLFGFLQNDNGANNDDQGSIEISLAGLFRCVLCTHGKASDEKMQLNAIAESLGQIGKRLESMEKVIDTQVIHNPGRRRVSFSGSHLADPLNSMEQKSGDKNRDDSDTESTVSQNTEGDRDRAFLVSPYWLEDEDLKKGEVDFLSPLEEQFWKDMLEKYLYPIDEDKKEKKRIAGDLKDLRDKSVFAFFMLNALFVLIVFLLQLNKDDLHIKWPFGGSSNITFDEISTEVHITTDYLQLEPIGLVFVFSFALILLIQFIAMMMHRFGTFGHILANTSLGWYCCRKPEDLTEHALHSKDAVEIVKDLQKLDGMDDDYETITENRPGRRKTIRNLEKNRRKTSTINNLDHAFRERFFSMAEGTELPRRVSARKSTQAFKAFEARRHSILAERRQSQMQMSGGTNTYGLTKNPLGLQQRKPRNSKIPKSIPENPSGGFVNLAFDPEDSPRI